MAKAIPTPQGTPQQSGSQTPGQQQGQSSCPSQQAGQPVFRDWASI